METNFEVKTVGVEYTCDKCEEGEMFHQEGRDTMLLTDPPRFEHVCTKCGYKQTFLKRYPTVEYKRVITK